MNPTPFPDAEVLARILREQRSFGRAAWLAERMAVERCGGALSRASWHPRDLAAEKRVRKTTGMTGGETCQCRQPNCGPCTADRLAGSTGCSCESPGCAICTQASVVGSSGVGERRRVPSEVAYAWDPPEDLVDLSPVIFDIHSHLFAAGQSDWGTSTAPGPRTGTADRVAWLYAARAEGISKMAISGLIDIGVPETDRVDDEVLDDMVEYAWNAHPDFFVPFVRGFELGEAGADAYVESWLRAGLQGVGELFVHGHGDDYTEIEPLVQILHVAAEYDVPVLVHWEFGNVFDPPGEEPIRPGPGYFEPTPADENFDQLLAVLDRFPRDPDSGPASMGTEPLPVKVIVAHAGAGPGDMDAPTLAAYTARLDMLLNLYPQVYFDISGLQTAATKQLFRGTGSTAVVTPLGALLLTRMVRWPGRFLVGIDVETKDATSTAEWIATIPNYRTFLALGPLSTADQARIRATNASDVLYSAPPAISSIGAIASRFTMPYRAFP